MQQSAVPEASGSVLAPDLRRFRAWTIALFCFSVVFHLVCGLVLHTHGQAAYPLSKGSSLFGDFTVFRLKFHYFHSPAFWATGYPLTYPAPGIIACEPFFRLGDPLDVIAFQSFYVLAFGVPAAILAKTLRRRGLPTWTAISFVLVITLCSWPVILLLDRGNVEVFVWLTLLIGMWAYSTGRLWTAAALFGVAASMKLFPFVLFGLFLSRKQYTKIVFGASCFLASTLACLAVLGPTIRQAWHQVALGLVIFKLVYMSNWLPYENGVDHSMFAFYKLIEFRYLHHTAGGFLRPLNAYLWTVSIGGILLYVFIIRKLPLLNQVFCLVIASIYFTAFSGDGTLIHLYYPFAMLILLTQRAWQDKVFIPGLPLVLGCMVVLLSCETFLINHDQRYIGPVHCVAMGVLLLAVLHYPLGPPLGDTTSERILSVPDTSLVPHAS